MSDTTPIPPASERERFERELARMPEWAPEFEPHRAWVEKFGWDLWQARAALSHPSTPQGWKQIGWTCGDGDCGRIHESPGAEGSYAVPVYVPATHTKETSP